MAFDRFDLAIAITAVSGLSVDQNNTTTTATFNNLIDMVVKINQLSSSMKQLKRIHYINSLNITYKHLLLLNYIEKSLQNTKINPYVPFSL